MSIAHIAVISFGREIPLVVSYMDYPGKDATYWEPGELPTLEIAHIAHLSDVDAVSACASMAAAVAAASIPDDDLSAHEMASVETALEALLDSRDRNRRVAPELLRSGHEMAQAAS